MNDYYNSVQTASPGQEVVSGFMNRVFSLMAMGLGLTALVSYITLNVKPLLALSINMSWILFIAEIGIVFYLAARVYKMSSSQALTWFLVYSGLNGITFTPIFLVYTSSAVATAFLVTAGMFGGMAVWGWTTQKDLSSLGALCGMAVWGLIIASVVNMFMHNTGLQLIISYAAVGIFTGLTAWDVQKLKMLARSGQMTGGIAIMGALQLYLDFINLFLNILYILGGRRD